MSDIKFSCPTCQQHIEADNGYAGLEIACPSCHVRMTVPGTPAQASAPAVAPVPANLPLRPAIPPAPAASGCPSCGAALARGAVLCTQCGYNLVTKQRTVAGRAAAPGAASSPNWEVPWYKTPYPYAGGVALILAVLYLLGKSHPPAMLAFLGLAGLYSVGVHILVVVAAFKEGAGTGFLALCIPFYAIYFVFKVSENPTLQVLYSLAVIINILLRVLPLPE